MIKGFKEFLLKNNVLALAVAVIVGGAVGKVVSSLAADILMPLISLVLPAGDWRTSKLVLSKSVGPDGKEVVNAISYGSFFGSVVDFLIIALVVIPYFNIIIDTEGLFLKDRKRRLRIFYIAAAGLSVFLWIFRVYVALVPTLILAAAMLIAAFSSQQSLLPLQRYLASKPLSWWIMTWFLIELVALTAVGTFFRGPGWSWIWPWRN